MHHLLIIVLKEEPKDREHLNELVTEAMAPHIEGYDEETDELAGFWDWYQIGGRWFGCFPVLEPTGLLGDKSWGHPEGFVPEGLLDCTRVGNVKELYPPAAFLAEGVFRPKIDWNTYPNNMSHEEWKAWTNRNNAEWETWSTRFWAGLHPDTWVVAVDYHS